MGWVTESFRKGKGGFSLEIVLRVQPRLSIRNGMALVTVQGSHCGHFSRCGFGGAGGPGIPSLAHARGRA